MSLDFAPQQHNEDHEEQIYTRVVRAGKRTYFLDVKSTRNGDYFLSITESRKKVNADGSSSFSRHQIYLYKEDFGKFVKYMTETINYIKEQKPEYFEAEQEATIDEEFDML